LETAELGEQLEAEAPTWLLYFMEKYLDGRFGVREDSTEMGLNSSSSSNTNIRRRPADNSHIIAMMSQLKKVNDWLD